MIGIETINQWAVVWAEFMYTRIVDSTLVFLLIGTFWLLVKRKVSAQFGYLLFLLVLLKLITPVQLSIPGLISYWYPGSSMQEHFYGYGEIGMFGAGATGAESETMNNAANPESNNTTPIHSTPIFDVPTVFMLLWIVGVFTFLLYQAWIEWKTRFMMHNTIALDPQLLPLDVQNLQEITGIKRRARWVTGHWVKSPVAYGYFRPMVAVPSDIAQHYTVKQLRWILLHELAHIQRGDMFVFLLQRILQALFFFHPFVWWANAIIDQLREYACDDAALAGSQCSPQECGEGFLGAVMRSNGLPTFRLATHGLINYKTMIRRRLMRILENTQPFQNRLTIASKVFLFIFTILIFPLSLNQAIAQMEPWKLLATDGPPARSNVVMAYDSMRDKVVLFGGNNTDLTRVFGDMWEWDGSQWAEISRNGSWPDARRNHAMVYDEARGKVVLFGGWNPEASLEPDPATWEYDGKQWIQVADRGPGVRGFHKMVYDSTRHRVVLHGGWWQNALQDTWAWNGTEWTLLSTSGPPTFVQMIAYDSKRDRVVMHGGLASYADNSIIGGTFEWDGNQWIDIQTSSTGPSLRFFGCMAFDSTRGKVVMYGGSSIYQRSAPNNTLNDLWEWDGENWMQIESSGLEEPRLSTTMIYDSKRDRMILFGGSQADDQVQIANPYFGDTWAFKISNSGFPGSLWSMY